MTLEAASHCMDCEATELTSGAEEKQLVMSELPVTLKWQQQTAAFCKQVAAWLNDKVGGALAIQLASTSVALYTASSCSTVVCGNTLANWQAPITSG